MKFAKGIVIGSLVSAGILMMYMDNNNMMNTKKVTKQGKKFIKKLGII